MSFRSSDPYGVTRSIEPKGVLPQQAQKLDVSLPLASDEIEISVSALNIDSASFVQIRTHCQDDIGKISEYINNLVKSRGKHHNPVTGSGGMLIGTVSKMGPDYPASRYGIKLGDKVASMVSLTLTPLEIQSITSVDLHQDRVKIIGRAILFSSSPVSKLPTDLSETLCLAALDVAGAPAHVDRLVKEGSRILVIGGAGKSGILSSWQAKQKKETFVVGLDYSDGACERLKSLDIVDKVIQADARNAVECRDKAIMAFDGQLPDIVINVANIPETEMATLLCTRDRGTAYFFSMATSFTRVALGAEGLGKDIEIKIGNGYAEGHSELTLNILRKSPKIKALFEKLFES